MNHDYEELMADMLGVSDGESLESAFLDKYGMDMDLAFKLVSDLLRRTPQVQAGLSGKKFHAFVALEAPVMLMRVEAK